MKKFWTTSEPTDDIFEIYSNKTEKNRLASLFRVHNGSQLLAKVKHRSDAHHGASVDSGYMPSCRHKGPNQPAADSGRGKEGRLVTTRAEHIES